jgi:hypothetical protein
MAGTLSLAGGSIRLSGVTGDPRQPVHVGVELVSELGDLSRVEHPRQLTAHVGRGSPARTAPNTCLDCQHSLWTHGAADCPTKRATMFAALGTRLATLGRCTGDMREHDPQYSNRQRWLCCVALHASYPASVAQMEEGRHSLGHRGQSCRCGHLKN